MDEELVSCANWLDFKNKAERNFESIEYFVDRFPTLENIQKDKLHLQFLNQNYSKSKLHQVNTEIVLLTAFGIF